MHAYMYPIERSLHDGRSVSENKLAHSLMTDFPSHFRIGHVANDLTAVIQQGEKPASSLLMHKVHEIKIAVNRLY